MFEKKSETVLEKQGIVLSANDNQQWRNLHPNTGRFRGLSEMLTGGFGNVGGAHNPCADFPLIPLPLGRKL